MTTITTTIETVELRTFANPTEYEYSDKATYLAARKLLKERYKVISAQIRLMKDNAKTLARNGAIYDAAHYQYKREIGRVMANRMMVIHADIKAANRARIEAEAMEIAR